jgi:hypothetical protein
MGFLISATQPPAPAMEEVRRGVAIIKNLLRQILERAKNRPKRSGVIFLSLTKTQKIADGNLIL